MRNSAASGKIPHVMRRLERVLSIPPGEQGAHSHSREGRKIALLGRRSVLPGTVRQAFRRSAAPRVAGVESAKVPLYPTRLFPS